MARHFLPALATSLAALGSVILAGLVHAAQTAQQFSLRSPDGQIELRFSAADGVPRYALSVDRQQVIEPSRLGFRLKGKQALDRDLEVVSASQSEADDTWTQPWGEDAEVRDHHRELSVNLRERSGLHRRLTLRFRAFDDGVGFRYEVPEQDALHGVEIMDEETEFRLKGRYSAWWIQANQPKSYELLYAHTALADLPSVHDPLVLERDGGLYLSLHEAALLDYASMALRYIGDNTLKADLVPWSDGVKVKTQTPFSSPWRTITVARSAGGLIESHLVLNLNEPNRLGDVGWVKPARYVGVWWEMHRQLATWGSGPHHGATTENTRRYIDFAAANGFGDVLVEGWNKGWDGNWLQNRTQFNYSVPYPDFDLPGLARYARDKGVGLILQNETAGGLPNYERQMEEAFKLYHQLGIPAVKTGCVAFSQDVDRVDENGLVQKEWHGGQYMVRFTQHLLEVAARNKLMVVTHEPVLEPGLRRTYPNLMAQEGARGQEYNAWSLDGGNPPSHTVIVPFTRLLAGPFDYTPGIVDLLYRSSTGVPKATSSLFENKAADAPPPVGKTEVANRVNSTLAKELALYVVLYSPVQMAADLPQNYVGNPAFKFIKGVPTDWQRSKVLNGEIGEYVTIARQQRGGGDWYIGSITNEQPRELDVPLSFLPAGGPYIAEIYRDGQGADWKSNPLPMDIVSQPVDAGTVLHLKLAPGGGQAIRLHPAPSAGAGMP